ARVTGETGITPIGAMGQITQFAYGLVSPGNLTANLMTANITGGAAGQCADLMQDLKTGLMIGARLRFQVIAQILGVAIGSLVGVAVYLTLIPDPAAMLMTADWPAPAVATWKAVAEVMTQGLASLPPGALPAMAVAAGCGIALALLERLLPPRIARRLPSAPAIGLAFVIPAWNGLSLFLGAALAAILARMMPGWSQRHAFGLAAGLVAGASLLGVATLALKLLVWSARLAALTVRSRAQGIEFRFQQQEGRRLRIGQRGGLARLSAILRHPAAGEALRRGEIVAGAVEHADRHAARDLLPALPVTDLVQVVGAHQPDEAHVGIMPPQLLQRVGRVARAQPRFHRGDPDARMAGHGLGAAQALRQRRHAVGVLERILRADQPPDAIELQPVQRGQADLAMRRMGRIEAAAEQANTQ